MLEKSLLEDLYLTRSMSMMMMAQHLGVSHHKVTYWMDKHAIKRRTISDAVYMLNNPTGDPFRVRPILNLTDAHLMGIGLGLYWGEGNKANKYSVRLGNTDPELIKTFIRFLTRLFEVHESDMRFGLQIFSDINPQKAKAFWIKELGVNTSQFYKITVTISGSVGSYRNKCPHGVLTVYYHNKRLRDTLVAMLPR